MTITKAIKIKEKYQYLLSMESHPELIIADQLSIEALKHYQEVRPLEVSNYYPLLPGETKD
ncbi:hypothetical protein ES708_28919 [subsurface metagenome]